MGNPKLVVSRLAVGRNFAVLPPESWVNSVLPGWSATQVNILAAPALGADFAQYMLTVEPGGGAAESLEEDIEAFFYVLSGGISLRAGGAEHGLAPGGFAYLAPGSEFTLKATAQARVLWLKKVYETHADLSPKSVFGNEQDVRGGIYMGNDRLLLKTLLPDDPAYDMAMNIFTFQPGESLPMTECHVMEHGLYFLEGQGVYFLDRKSVV
jgi:(S)-ureidoglycine aminohydrolase